MLPYTLTLLCSSSARPFACIRRSHNARRQNPSLLSQLTIGLLAKLIRKIQIPFRLNGRRHDDLMDTKLSVPYMISTAVVKKLFNRNMNFSNGFIPSKDSTVSELNHQNQLVLAQLWFFQVKPHRKIPRGFVTKIFSHRSLLPRTRIAHDGDHSVYMHFEQTMYDFQAFQTCQIDLKRTIIHRNWEGRGRKDQRFVCFWFGNKMVEKMYILYKSTEFEP